MFEKRKTHALEHVYRISFAFLVGIGAAASIGIKTGHLSIGIATGIAVFFIFGLEFDQSHKLEIGDKL